MFASVFRAKLGPAAVAQRLVEGTDPADLLKACKGCYSAADLPRVAGELLSFQIFIVDFNLWVGVRDIKLRDQVLDAYYPGISATLGLGPEFYQSPAFVERMQAYRSALNGPQGPINLTKRALAYFDLKPGSSDREALLEADVLAYLQLMSKTIQSALKKVLILEQQNAH